MPGRLAKRGAKHGITEVVRPVLQEALELAHDLVAQHLRARAPSVPWLPGEARGSAPPRPRRPSCEAASLEESPPLVGGDVRRLAPEGRQQLAHRPDLARVRVHNRKVVAALHAWNWPGQKSRSESANQRLRPISSVYGSGTGGRRKSSAMRTDVGMVELDRMLGCLFVREDADPRAILARGRAAPGAEGRPSLRCPRRRRARHGACLPRGLLKPPEAPLLTRPPTGGDARRGRVAQQRAVDLDEVRVGHPGVALDQDRRPRGTRCRARPAPTGRRP